ncbi:MAG: class I SAM-dependent methyltransferase [Rhodospirillales bacterium]|nr:class I SAM-dependent methyltransferase [Alphaproteobacteria bacterium]MCB1839689.1 class I SAM-dependent methyltransferase [Alphaproteobacteria bacterium]MCB9977496.1 class I SAM-dependent methyltransferase [Rhodospirillales bacterium]
MNDREFWDERFGAQGYAYGTEPNVFLEESVSFIPSSGQVLCIAEGEGRNAVFLAKNGFDVSAVDISHAGKRKTETLASENGVQVSYTISDLDDFDLGAGAWDAIVSIFGYIGPNAEARKFVYQRIQKGLKPGGIFIVEAYHPRQLEYGTGGPKDIDFLPALEEFKKAFEASGFLHGAEREREVFEGEFHTGASYVTQVVWKKA